MIQLQDHQNVKKTNFGKKVPGVNGLIKKSKQRLAFWASKV